MSLQEELIRVKKKLSDLQEKHADLLKRYDAVSSYAPAAHKCRKCSGYFIEGYVCFCGKDNSINDGEYEDCD